MPTRGGHGWSSLRALGRDRGTSSDRRPHDLRKALRWRLTAENPFDGVRGGHQMNESRKQFVPREDIDA